MFETRVGFQGELGAFSTQAALLMVKNAELVPYPDFRALFEGLERGEIARAVVPIENVLAGAVAENLDLLAKFQFPIFRECTIRIVHHLIAVPGVCLSDVRHVYSHPVAIRQCLGFLYDHRSDFNAVDGGDTAGSVKKILEGNIMDAAAIASEACAKRYGGNILVRDIGDHQENYTRFFLVGPPRDHGQKILNGDKIFVMVGLRNVRGSLSKFLEVFRECGLNLSHIDSRPIPGKPFEYLFFAEFESVGHSIDLSIPPLLAAMQNTIIFFAVLGPFYSERE